LAIVRNIIPLTATKAILVLSVVFGLKQLLMNTNIEDGLFEWELRFESEVLRVKSD
jgi:hypothetical protein